MYGIDLLSQLGILQTLQDAPFLRFVQRGRERLVFLFQLFVFGGSLGEGNIVLPQLVLYPCHVGDTSIRRTGCTNFFREKCTFYGQG